MVDLSGRKRVRQIIQDENDEPEEHSSVEDEMLSMTSTETEEPSTKRLARMHRGAPAGFLCPLTMEIMFDPVLDNEGNTYERKALVEWLKDNRTSPVSRQPLSERMIIPNNALRETIHEYMGAEWVARKLAEYRQFPGLSSNNRGAPRDRIDCFLEYTARELGGLKLKLNGQGCCAFRYDNITIVLDVPERVGVFCLYTRNLLPDFPEHVKVKVYTRALELNFLQGDTRGGCLSIRRHEDTLREEVMFSYTDRIPEVSAKDFSNILLNFVETSVRLRDKLLLSMMTMPMLMPNLIVGGPTTASEALGKVPAASIAPDAMPPASFPNENEAYPTENTSSPAVRFD